MNTLTNAQTLTALSADLNNGTSIARLPRITPVACGYRLDWDDITETTLVDVEDFDDAITVDMSIQAEEFTDAERAWFRRPLGR